jgi:hypothetical protein
MLDAGEQFVAADRLFDEIRSPGLHGSDCHRHVALTGDHDGRQPISLSLARFWRDQRKAAEARNVLAPVHGWFTEGFDTPDLKEAKALLDALNV